jgi:versiconal hemiacetal acetate esterase
LASYPPTYIVTSGKDILRDDGIVLERLLRDAGVEVKRDHYEEYPHYFFVFPSLKMSRTYLENVAQGIRLVLGIA